MPNLFRVAYPTLDRDSFEAILQARVLLLRVTARLLIQPLIE
jgi:hypothetical protein